MSRPLTGLGSPDFLTLPPSSSRTAPSPRPYQSNDARLQFSLFGFGVEMPISLTILGVFGGFLAFGFLGLFIGPTLIAILFTLLQAWRSAISSPSTDDAMRPAA